ncbi:MAG: histidine kinase, partial [Chloroflexi bacterium]
IILEEQERIRGALQIAIGRYTVEIKEVQDIAKKANEANEFKSQFIARMSHELRTPLGALLGLAEMLQQNVYGVLTPPQLDIVQRIISNAEELKQVFTELLDQSQIEAGHLRLKERAFSPEALARKVNSNYLAMALQKGLSMHVETAPDLPTTLFGDEARIAQVLSNLVVNAIKFTKKGGVTIRVFKGDDSRWGMQVKDTGIGIGIENQAQIFEPFRQADEGTSRAYGGVGLGLAIVQQLVQAMNGSIQLESKPGQGSTFTVSLPIRESEAR